MDKDFISFSHCWCQHIYIRQWEAKNHEVCWISPFSIWIRKEIYRGTLCKLLGKTRHIRLLSLSEWSETKLHLYQKLIISLNWIFSFSIYRVRIRFCLVLNRYDCGRIQWNWLFQSGQTMTGKLGESFKNLFSQRFFEFISWLSLCLNPVQKI